MGPSLPPNRALYFGFRPGSFRKWYSLNHPTFFAKKWSSMSLMVSSFRFFDEQGWRNGQTITRSLLHSCPLQQNYWIQTFAQVTREDLIYYNFWVGQPEHSHVWLGTLQVLLVTTRQWFFLRCTRDGFDWFSGVVVLCLSPAEVQGTLMPLVGTGLGPGMLG